MTAQKTFEQRQRATPAPRGVTRLLFAPVVGPFFWGKLLSTSGIWIHNIVAAIVAFQITGSALVVGAVSAVQFIPQLLLSPLSGKLSDSSGPRRQIVLGRLIIGVGSCGLAAWIWLVGGVEALPGAAPVIGSSLVVGLGLVLSGPPMQAIVPDLIRPGEMSAAMALNSVPMTVGRAAGPALGALVAATASPELAFLIAGAAEIAFAVVVQLLIARPRRCRPRDADLSVRASLRHLRRDPPSALLLVGIAAAGFGADPALTLAPSLTEALGGGPHLVGWLTSSCGIGAGIGFLAFNLARRRARLPILASAGLTTTALGLTATSFSASTPWALSSLIVAGIGLTLSVTSISTLLQDRTPDVLRGRIMAYWFAAFLGARPFAAALNGFLADAVSVNTALLVTSAFVVVAAAMCRPSKLQSPGV